MQHKCLLMKCPPPPHLFEMFPDIHPFCNAQFNKWATIINYSMDEKNDQRNYAGTLQQKFNIIDIWYLTFEIWTFENLNILTFEHFDIGTFEHFDIGTLEHWHIRTLEHLDIWTLVNQHLVTSIALILFKLLLKWHL